MKEDKTASKPWWRGKSSFAVKCTFLTVSILLILYLAVKIFLSSSYAAGLASDYLSGILHQRVVVSGLTLSGTTFSLNGIAISNPEGFPAGKLLDARSLSVAPDITQMIAGKRTLALLRVAGMKVELQKNTAGEWNFSELVRFLSRKKKKPAAELVINRLIIRDSTMKIGDYSLEKLALTLKDFSTKGLADSKLVIRGNDEKGNPFRMDAEGRLGNDPDMHLSLEAPHVSTETLRLAFRGKSFLALEKGVANISLAAGYRSGVAVAKGRMEFAGLELPLKGRKPAFRGRLDFAGRYVVSHDEADLERIVLVINDRVRFDASGTVQKVRSDRKFAGELSSSRIPLSEFRIFLPPASVKDITLNGTVECRDLRLMGNGTEGITSGKGKILVRDGKAVKGGQTLFKDLSSEADIARAAGGWTLDGTLSMNARAGEIPLENVHARFASRFSDRFNPVSLEIPLLNAVLMGVPVHGMLSYSPKMREPYTGKLSVKNARLTSLNKLVSLKNIHFVSGTADLTVWGNGKGLSSFGGKMDARIRGLKGHISGKDCALKDAEITSHFSRSGAGLSAKGRFSADGGIFAGKDFSGKFGWSLAGDKLKLSDGAFGFDRARARFAAISGRLPVREKARDRVRYPLELAFSGMDLTMGETVVKDISGRVSGAISPGSGRLTGSTSLVLSSVNYRRRHIGSMRIKATMSGEKAVVETEGTALGGSFSSEVKLDPFSPAKGFSFKGKLAAAQALGLSGVLPDSFKLDFPSGKISTSFDGNWSDETGLRLGLEGSGSGLSVAVKGWKTVLSGANVEFRTDIEGKDLTIKEAVIGKGDAVALKIAGTVANVASRSRKGVLSLALGTVPVNSLLDTFANILPRALQEADGGGNFGAQGSLGFDSGKVLLEGNAKFENARLDIPSQKMSLSGLDGSLPFSAYLAGSGIEKPSTDANFTRENFQSLLKSLGREAKGGSSLKIGKASFGALETDGILMKIRAEKGRIEITSVESALYNGTVLGKGWFVYDRGPNYGLDLLINNLSLRSFCLSYPAVKGYISGLLDGIISIYGGKGGLPDLIGYIDLWTREGKGEEMLVSKEFLQKLAGRNLKGFFFRDDRPYDHGEISAYLMDGYVTFEKLDISHTNFFGMKDLNVSVAPVQNMIGIDHLLQTIREAAARGKPAVGGAPKETPAQPDINWLQ